MAKKKNKEEGLALQEQKPLEFMTASLRDGFCDYSYEIKVGPGTGFTHSVKGKGIYEPDLAKAFNKLNVHLALIDDVFKHSGLDVESVNDVENTPLTDLYEVTGFKMKGNEENLSIILTGTKFVSSTGGERIQLVSPKISLVAGSIYKWNNELKEASDMVRHEVELYHGGKYTNPEVEPVDKNQLSIEDSIHQTEEETV